MGNSSSVSNNGSSSDHSSAFESSLLSDNINDYPEYLFDDRSLCNLSILSPEEDSNIESIIEQSICTSTTESSNQPITFNIMNRLHNTFYKYEATCMLDVDVYEGNKTNSPDPTKLIHKRDFDILSVASSKIKHHRYYLPTWYIEDKIVYRR